VTIRQTESRKGGKKKRGRGSAGYARWWKEEEKEANRTSIMFLVPTSTRESHGRPRLTIRTSSREEGEGGGEEGWSNPAITDFLEKGKKARRCGAWTVGSGGYGGRGGRGGEKGLLIPLTRGEKGEERDFLSLGRKGGEEEKDKTAPWRQDVLLPSEEKRRRSLSITRVGKRKRGGREGVAPVESKPLYLRGEHQTREGDGRRSRFLIFLSLFPQEREYDQRLWTDYRTYLREGGKE